MILQFPKEVKFNLGLHYFGWSSNLEKVEFQYVFLLKGLCTWSNCVRGDFHSCYSSPFLVIITSEGSSTILLEQR
jgi:hypothetical protein